MNKKLISITLNKEVTDYNNESEDWSGDSRHILYETTTKTTKEGLIKWLENYGLDFNNFKNEMEDNRYDYCQNENNDGYQDNKGLFLADYTLTIDIYQLTNEKLQ